jgi:hypothetical protein
MAALSPRAEAQRVQLNPFVGYRVFGSYQDYTGRDYDVKDNLAYGGALIFAPQKYAGVELRYSHQGTEVEVRPLSGASDTYDLNVDQWSIGGWRDLSTNRVRPVFGGGLGMTSFYGDDFNGSEQRFAFNAFLGLKAWNASDRIAFSFDARGFFTLLNGGAGGGCAYPASCGLAFSGDLFFQGELTAVLVIGLGK